MKNKLFITLMIVISTQGCSIMPYQEESLCRFNDFGKCVTIDRAYKEAVTGIDQGGKLVSGGSRTMRNKQIEKQAGGNIDLKNQMIYQDTKNLMNPTEKIPLLQPAVVRRVFINAHKSIDSSIWYEPKNVYYIEKQPKWTLDFSKENNTSNTLNLFK